MNAKPATSSQLTVADIEAVAVRVAKIVREHVPVGSTRYVDAAELANVLGVEREWIYAMPQTSVRCGWEVRKVVCGLTSMRSGDG
jgi:hypothetical protein